MAKGRDPEQPVPKRQRTQQDGDGHVFVANEGSHQREQVTHGGRVDVHLTERAQRQMNHLQKRAQWSVPMGQELTKNNRNYEAHFQELLKRYSGVPRLNIAIQIVGSRGDVQPFLAIGQILSKPPYGHRVRICTHPAFKEFVEENGLEFFSIGGDPATLMAYMVKNPGLLPGRESWKAGDVGKRRADFEAILEGCWRSCVEAGNGMGDETDETTAKSQNLAEWADRSFIADAIIANPPSYGHIHCAEKLGIPLHMMFTMPWSPTQYFPHPLAALDGDEFDPKLANYMSYTVMELLAWQGLGDVINAFRVNTLRLEAISPLWGHMLISRLKVPFTYLWSSALIPKPPDWGSHINITGFPFLKAASNYKPDDDLVEFLKAGPPPIYIGFGSIVIDKPAELTKIIFGAVKRTGVRALISKGWGGLGEGDAPEGVFLLENCPHDWLFPHVSCVVHHGGAGTTAIGISLGKPTIIVPFFGDQLFWGSMVYRAGAGPEPVPYKSLTEEKLAESITKALGPDIQTAVKKMSEKIAGEDGCGEASKSFHQWLNYDSMRCLLCPDKVAVWRVRKTNLRLSALATTTLIDNGLLTLREVKLIKHRDWYIDEGASNPLSGAVASITLTLVNTWISTHTYIENLAKLRHQKPSSKSEDSQSEPQPEIPDLESLPVQFPVQAAMSYPPEILESMAYRMASKTLPSKRERAKREKMQSGTPGLKVQRSKSAASSASRRKKHGKVSEAAIQTERFTVSIISIGFKAPIGFFYNLANGFNNAPSFILHDETVRRRDKITGFGSGVKVAAKGFVYNIFDGFTGIVTHPYRDAKKQGVKGFGKGVGRGIGGLVFKSTAAVVGLPGYTLKGVEKQMEKRFDRDLKAKILEVRMRQGLAAFERASDAEKQEILKRWKEYGVE